MTDRTIQPVNIESEMRDAYLSYAMSVIVSRALPDARDGLKPVHRRILYAMHDMGVGAASDHKKSARIVGEVLGKYHPHGDGAVYDTMVRMAQDFAMRYMLIDGQGNFGSIDGDGAAAMRYTEARMARLGGELLVDINKDTVDFVENFDGALVEPSVLPSLAPNLLVNGASGIAVGMSTNIPPHNLGEICDALAHMLQEWERLDEVDVDELRRFVRGPDFPTGGVIYKMRGDSDMLRAAYATGRGKITLRAKAHVEDMGRGKSRIIVSELPYQTNKTSLIERIASLVSSGRLEGLADLRDESDRQNSVRLVIELARNADVTATLAQLFKLTPLQTTFGIIMLALVDGQPRLLTLKAALRVYLEHRLEVIQRRSRFDLARARERAHVLEGLLVALDNLDAVIRVIRKSRSSDTARRNLIKNFKVSEAQAAAILEMPLRRLASLEIRRIRQEHKEKRKLIKELESLLASPVQQRQHIAAELAAIKRDYGDPRRTTIAEGEATGLTRADFLAPEEKTVVMLSSRGQLSRTPLDEAPKVRATDRSPPRLLQHSTTGQILYLFAENGDCGTAPVQQIPQAERAADGAPYWDLTALTSERKAVAFVCLPMNLRAGYLCFATARGQLKRLALTDLPGLTARSFSVIKLAKGDKLVAALYSQGDEDLALTTARGYAIRFKETDVRPTGLTSGGVRGIELGKRPRADNVVAAFLARESTHGWTVTEDGYARVTRIGDYKLQGRGGKGLASKWHENAGKTVAAATAGKLDDTVLVLTNKDKAKYMSLKLAQKRDSPLDDSKQVIALREKERVIAVVEYRPRIEMTSVASTPSQPDRDVEPAADALDSEESALEPDPTLERPAQIEMNLLPDAADPADSSNGAGPALSDG